MSSSQRFSVAASTLSATSATASAKSRIWRLRSCSRSRRIEPSRRCSTSCDSERGRACLFFGARTSAARVSGVIRVVSVAVFPLNGPCGFRPPPGALFLVILDPLFGFRIGRIVVDQNGKCNPQWYCPVLKNTGSPQMSTDEQPKTLPVPEAGRRYFGLGRNASYAAAKRGDIPTVRVGRLLRAPVVALERRLERAGQTERGKPDSDGAPTHKTKRSIRGAQ